MCNALTRYEHPTFCFALAPKVNWLGSPPDRFKTWSSSSLTYASLLPSGDRCGSMIGEPAQHVSLSSDSEPDISWKYT